MDENQLSAFIYQFDPDNGFAIRKTDCVGFEKFLTPELSPVPSFFTCLYIGIV